MGTESNPETVGMTLRELVLEVRDDVKRVRAQVDTHLLEHAIAKGQARGEARVLGIGRSALAIAISLVSSAVAIASVLLRP